MSRRKADASSAGSFFFQAEDGIRDDLVTGVQTCALPICHYFARLFDYATVTFYTHSTGIEDFEPVEGTYEFASRDLFVHHLERMGMEIEGRPLVWLHSMVAPEWQAAKDYDGLLAYLRRLI